jgi:hypothetical protein
MRSGPRSRLENCAVLTAGRPPSERSMEFREWPAVGRHATADEFSPAGVPGALRGILFARVASRHSG